ncbi:MAG: lamin tail domain-containing protein [Bacteroidota bacterium]
MRTLLLVLLSIGFSLTAHAQVDITTLDTPVTDDFNTFDGSGFAPTPTAGQLDSDTYIATGMTDGPLTFGGTETSGDFTGAIDADGVGGGGIYAAEVAASDIAWGVQPTGNDFTPGTFVVQAQNNTSTSTASATVAYEVHVYNDQARSNSFGQLGYAVGTCGTEPGSYTAVANTAVISPEAADSTPAWVVSTRLETFPVVIADGECLFLEFLSDDVSGSNSRDQFALDDLSIAFSATLTTTVALVSTSASVNEGDGTTDLIVGISNPSATVATTVEVALTSGQAADLDNYTTQTVTFAAGSSANETLTLTLTDDMTVEINEDFVFMLQNATGGESASVGSPDTFTLTIQDNDGNTITPGDLVITEFMANPDSSVGTEAGEYLEVHNPTSTALNLAGLTFEDADGKTYTLPALLLQPGTGSDSFVLLCNRDTILGGVACDANFCDDGGDTTCNNAEDPTLNNSGLEQLFIKSGSTVIAQVTYNQGDPNGAEISRELRALSLVPADGVVTDNRANFGGNPGGDQRLFVDATTEQADGSYGSPKAFGNTASTATSMTLGGVLGTADSLDAGWYMLAVPASGVTMADIAAQNLVQGIDGYFDDDANAANIYTLYAPGATGANLDFVEPGTDANDDSGAGSPSDGTDYEFVPGRGFIWYHYDLDLSLSPSSSVPMPYTLSATGSEPSGPVTFTVPAGEFYLTGNPYQNSLALSGVTQSGGSGTLSDVVQVWDPFTEDGGGTGAYRVFSRAAADVMATWQGFFVENTDGSNTADVSVADTDSRGGTFYGRTASGDRRRLGFKLSGLDPAQNVGTLDVATVLQWIPLAEDGDDAFDGSKLNPLAGVYGTLAFVGEREGEPHLRAVDSRPYDAVDFEVDLDFQTNISGTFTLTWPVLEDVPATWRIELEDRETGAVTDLRADDAYTFAGTPGIGARSEGPHDDARPALPATLRATPSWLHAEARSTGPRFVLRVLDASVSNEDEALADGYALSAVYPNPFSAQATLSLHIDKAQTIRAEVFDALGRRVAVLADGVKAPGSHRLEVDGAGWASGLYVIRVVGDRFIETRRVTVVRE